MASSSDEVTPHPGSGPDDCSPADVRYRTYVLEKSVWGSPAPNARE